VSGTDPAHTGHCLLFTAFEPSGDDHASAVIAELKRRRPDLPIYAWGGPKMERAGAVIVERTGDDAVMGMPGWRKIREHTFINERIEGWMREYRPLAHIPVDSPAANFPICKAAKALNIKVIHLVAPQIWAWGRWRINKLRRLTDLVLCLLPFEEGFFLKRGVSARFIGHPLFDEPLDLHEIERRAKALGDGSPRIALMPGSRPRELEGSWPLLLEAFRSLRASYPGLRGVVAATRPAVEQDLLARASLLGGMPEGLSIIAGDADAVIGWCDLALVKSGTITLQIARQTKPMVIFYKQSSPMLYHSVAWVAVATKFFTLPNILAHREIVPELVPHFGGADEIVAAARTLLDSPDLMIRQRQELGRIVEVFKGRNASAGAADAIEEVGLP
jgi:lipid-A-disaccharide synthase